MGDNMKKQNIIIIVITLIIILLATGYALFNESLDIHGTVAASGSFNVEFYSIGQETAVGYTKQTTDPEHQLATRSQDHNAVVIRVNKLDYPGAYVLIPITIKNVGELDAVLTGINVTGSINLNSTPIRLTYLYEGEEFNDLDAADKLIEVNDTKEIQVKVEWLENDNTTVEEPSNPESNPQFTITLDYDQTN